MIELINEIFHNDVNIKGSALALWIALANMANKDGECWPGHANLARQIRCSRRYLLGLMEQLENRGVLQIKPREGRAHVYKIFAEPQSELIPHVKRSSHVKPGEGVKHASHAKSVTCEAEFTTSCEAAFTGGVNGGSHKPPLTANQTTISGSLDPFLDSGEKILKDLKATLKFQLSDFVGWQRNIQPLQFIAWDGKTLRVGSENEPSIDWLKYRAKSTIDRALIGVIGDPSVGVEFALIDGNNYHGQEI